MANSIFKEFGQKGNPLEQQFEQFVQQMQGRDPNEMINQLLKSGKINQQQLNAAQMKAKEMESFFSKFMRR